MINIFYKVTKEAVDKSHPDTALLYLKFKATLKAEQMLSDLELTFKGMKDEESLIITTDDLKSIQSHNSMIHNDIYLQ